MMSSSNNNLSYDYAAMVFQRKTAQNKLFEFQVPLSLAPKVIQAISYLMKENHKFFANSKE